MLSITDQQQNLTTGEEWALCFLCESPARYKGKRALKYTTEEWLLPSSCETFLRTKLGWVAPVQTDTIYKVLLKSRLVIQEPANSVQWRSAVNWFECSLGVERTSVHFHASSLTWCLTTGWNSVSLCVYKKQFSSSVSGCFGTCIQVAVFLTLHCRHVSVPTQTEHAKAAMHLLSMYAAICPLWTYSMPKSWKQS